MPIEAKKSLMRIGEIRKELIDQGELKEFQKVRERLESEGVKGIAKNKALREHFTDLLRP